MKKITYIVSDIDKALSFEWVASHFNTRCKLFFILIGKEKSALQQFLEQNQIRHVVLSDTDFPGAWRIWFQLFRVLRSERPDIVHAHLWRATLFGMTAAWLAGVRRRIFTRHHGMIHYNQYPSGRKWDRLCNWMATDIVAISASIKAILADLDGAKADKITVIHHGFDFSYFTSRDERSVAALRQRHNIPSDKKIIGAIARYTSWKGLQYTIPAFQDLVQQRRDVHLVLANAHGDFAPTIRQMLKALPQGSYTEIPFESDLTSLYAVMDLHVHVPVDARVEAFGQTYVEALIAGVPSIFTLSGVAAEFIRHKQNAWVVPFEDSAAITLGMQALLNDEPLRQQMAREGFSSVRAFELKGMLGKLQALYD